MFHTKPVPLNDEGCASVGGNDLAATDIVTAILDELPDSMTADTKHHAISLTSHERYRPTHPASDISALRRAVSAALADEAVASQSRNTGAPSSMRPPEATQREQAMVTHRDQCKRKHNGRPDQTLQNSQAIRIDLPHHHPEAPGTPWPTSPPLEVVDDFEGDQAVSRRDFVEQPSRIPIDKVPLAADADLTEPLHATALDTAPLLPEQSPAALVTSDVVEDPRAGSKLRRPASRRSQSSDGEARWPSASEMSPEALREYLLSMEVAKPKPRPRRKHLDHKLERQRMKQELEDILARRADLMSLEEAGSAPPVMPERDELDRRFDGEETVQQASASSPPSAAAYQHPLYAGSASSSGSLQPIGGSNKLEGESIEEEILRLNDSVEALMISINELDKVKDPQIELSFTGPKTKNLQRARPDDELWTDLTGRAPGIRRLSGFGTAYDTERTILTPTVSECSEVPTLSPMSSRSNLSIASSRSAMSARSTRSDTGHRSTHHLSIMQTLAEAEDSDQGNAQNTGFAAETEEGSLAVTAGSVAIDQGSWQRDLENWARHSSPPLDEIADPTDVDESQLSPASSLHRRRTNKDRHLSSSSTIATASSTISYLVRFNATSPRLHSNSESGSSDSQPQRLSLHIPHDSQRGTSRKPPSSKRTRQQHIVAGLQGDEWSGHRSLTAELQAATSMQQKAASEAFSSQKEQNEYSGTKATSPLAEQSTADTDSPARSMSPARTRSPLTASSTLRIAAEALSESVTSVAQAVGLIGESSDTKADAGEMQNHDITRSLSEQSRRPDESQVPLAPILQVEVSSPDRAIRSVDSEAPETYDSRACAKPQRQDTNLKSPSRKKAKRTRLTEAQTEQQRLKEAARHIKEQQKAARWHQRHLAIDAKKAFQTKKDELHTRLANTRNEDARSEVQWELGELYAAYAWGETSETPTGRDKPALGAGALTHALRVMYEALYAPSRRDKSTISSVALDPDKWGRYAHLHMIMWGQTRGKTHLEWALRAYNEAIKLSGDKTELTGDICTTAAQFLQTQAGNSPELLQRAVNYWQRSMRCKCSDNTRMAWRYVNLAHCYDVLTSIGIARPNDDLDPTVLRGLCIDAIERAHSLDPTNASHSERLQYYQDCRDDEQGSLEESGETLDDEESSSRSRTSSRSFGQRTGVHPLVSHAAQEAGSNKYTPGPLENHQDGNQMHIASMALRTADVGPVQETFADEHDNRHELDDDPDSDTTLAEPIYQVNPQLDHARVSQSQSPVSSRSASPIDSTAGIASAYARTTEHLHPSRASRSQEGEDLRLARNDDPSDLSQAQIPDVRIDAHAHLPSTDHLNGAQDDEQWKEEPGVEHYDRSAVHSAPPHHLPRQRAVSGANQRATSASPQVPHQHEYSPIEPRVLLHTLQQYHEAIQHTNGRLAAVESDVQRNTEELAERSYANERQLHEQYSPLCQRLSQTEETLTRHDEELRAIRASLDRIAARFDDMEARRAGTRAPLQNRNHDEHPAISSSPRNTRIAIQPITSTPQPRSRPTSMVFEAEQRARSVPPMQTGHSSVAGHSDDPPPSFHSRVDEAYGTRSMHDNTRFQPYFGAGESFDTFDKQAILERGAILFGLYSLRQLARQTGLQTPLFPPPDTARGG